MAACSTYLCHPTERPVLHLKPRALEALVSSGAAVSPGGLDRPPESLYGFGGHGALRRPWSILEPLGSSGSLKQLRSLREAPDALAASGASSGLRKPWLAPEPRVVAIFSHFPRVDGSVEARFVFRRLAPLPGAIPPTSHMVFFCCTYLLS